MNCSACHALGKCSYPPLSQVAVFAHSPPSIQQRLGSKNQLPALDTWLGTEWIPQPRGGRVWGNTCFLMVYKYISLSPFLCFKAHWWPYSDASRKQEKPCSPLSGKCKFSSLSIWFAKRVKTACNRCTYTVDTLYKVHLSCSLPHQFSPVITKLLTPQTACNIPTSQTASKWHLPY